MTSAAEAFVIALGRASRRVRWLLRKLSHADRDDVLATALLWCWENRATYSPRQSLEEWFNGAVSNARKAWHKGEGIHAHQLPQEIPVPDEAQAYAATLSAAQKLIRKLSPQECRVAAMQAGGATRAEIESALHVSKYVVDQTRKHLRKLRGLIPDANEVVTVLRTAAARNDENPRGQSRIDRALEKLYQPDLGNSSTFADDYRMGERVYAKAEDIRGTEVEWNDKVYIVADYEGNPAHRRLSLYNINNDTSLWVSEDFIGDFHVRS